MEAQKELAKAEAAKTNAEAAKLMKHINIVIIDGVERDMAALSAEERLKIVNELNRVAVGYLGYQKEKTA